MVQDVVYIELTDAEKEIIETVRKMSYGRVTVHIENHEPVRITEEKNTRL